MKTPTKIPMFIGLFFLIVHHLTAFTTTSNYSPDDIYIIIYTTKDGLTGHVGIAIDNYDIFIEDEIENGQSFSIYDTLSNGSLTYFDLWGPTDLDYKSMNKNAKPRYFKLPRSSAEERITVDYFLTKGLPHSYDYPCDALLRIRTNPKEDYDLKDSVDLIMKQFDFFNPIAYNCTDFIVKSLETHLQSTIDAKELILFSKSSTPNQLYITLTENFNVDIIKNPGNEINQSFFKERIFKMFFQTK